MAKKSIEISIKKYLEALRSNNIRVNKVILYGSHANGTFDKDSDIDLAIISPDLGQDSFDEAIMLRKLTRGIDLDISPRPYSVKQYQEAGKGDFLYDEVIRKGKVVYDKE
ncbi:MAG: nucleotidyltransferase domain-containing protein [Thermincola sp.]|jgi:predicted nucleotidyltransferase|nr:nucleotidyltransferase domain-containing protein [Thermincola sp.]MDT3702552.1 nucleotidyltransferase domain-containing protein [Thermincola sp.]